MPVVVNHHPADAVAQHELTQPRDDWVVAEAPSATGFGLAEGPFSHWQRTIGIADDGSATETIEFRLAAPFWRVPLNPLVRWALRRPPTPTAPWWAPPQRFDRHGFEALGLLIFATMAAAYLGTLLSQTVTFVADEFDADESTQGLVTALTRVGALLALGVVWLADRAGRRRVLLAAGAGAALLAATTALSPNIWAFGAAQTLSRGLATGFALLIAIFAAEESPAGSRAWVVSVLALFAGLGSGMVLWLLPVAGLGDRAWRVLFVVALLALPVLLFLRRRLNETRRFDAWRDPNIERAAISRSMVKRFTMLAAVGFAVAAFAAPSSNFQNEYLRESRGFSPARISLYSAVVSTPVGIGVAIAGPIADRRGRRAIGAIGIIAGALFAVVRYGVSGPMMWISGVLGTVIGAAAIPALGVYGPEMFPTSRRGQANGLLTCVSVVGSALGLVFVGFASEAWGFGRAFAVVAVLPLLAVLVIARYPETAARELEELNPEDGPTVQPREP